MRRLAKVFVCKRAERDKDKKQPPSVPVPPSKHPGPRFLRNLSTNNTHSSSSSSASTNVSVRTPDDDDLNPTPNGRRSWKFWMGAKSRNLLTKPQANDDDDNDDDDDDDNPLDSIPYDVAPVALKNLEIHTRNSLIPPLPISPFVHHQPGPLFPRSANCVFQLPQKSTLRVQILKSRLLSRLSNLPPQHLSAIIPFSARPTPSLIPPSPLSDPDISHPSGGTKVFSASPGLHRWISRPCFEDRCIVYFPSEHGVDCRPVSAASLAIAALEYSEHLDVMVDPDFDQPPKSITFDTWSLPAAEPTLPATQFKAPTPDPPVPVIPPVQSRNFYTATPSPLRNEHGLEPVFSVKVDNPDVDKPPNKVAKSAVKRVVRFVEDDDDDGIPLHIVRMKKKREEKAKFLQQERSRREQQHVEEKLRLEREALEKERRRLAKEQEKKEREMASYAETVAAARVRRESQRAGGVPSASTNNPASNHLLARPPSLTSLRDSERNKPPESKKYPSQLSYDPPAAVPLPRRDFSDSALHSKSYFNFESDSPSPGSSRPPSLAHSPVSPTGMGMNSRPPSSYSSSSEDIRHQNGSRRDSMMAAAAPSSFNGRPPMVVSYPTWSGSNPNFQYVPPVPMFPVFAHEMPLLPPTAPFMKHRRSSRGSASHGPPSTSSSRRGSTSSTERANVPASLPRASSAPRYLAQPPNSPMSSPRNVDGQHRHERRSSGDSRNSSWTQSSQRPRPPYPPNSYSQSVSSRGRPPIPHTASSQYLQAPSPWTALPTQNGMIPVAMPISSYSHTNLHDMPPSRTSKASGKETIS